MSFRYLLDENVPTTTTKINNKSQEKSPKVNIKTLRNLEKNSKDLKQIKLTSKNLRKLQSHVHKVFVNKNMSIYAIQ